MAGAPVTYLRTGHVATKGQPRVRTRARSDSAAWLIGISFGLYLAAAWTLNSLAIADDQTMAHTVQGWLAVFGATPGVAHLTAGGDAPLALLLQLPFAALPNPGWPAWPATVVSCSMAALLLAAVAHGLKVLGAGPRSRLALLALCALQPVLVLGAATGASGTTAAALGAWAIVLSCQWAIEDRAVDLIASAFVIGLAALASYWMLLVAVAMLVVLLVSRSDRTQANGEAVAYATPVAAVLLPWFLVAWLSGASAFGQLPAFVPLALPDLNGQAGSAGIAAACLAGLSACFCLAAAARDGVPARKPLELTLAAVTLGLLIQPIAALASSGHMRAGELLPLLPAGILLAGWWLARGNAHLRLPIVGGLLLASAGFQLWAADSGLGSMAEQQAARALTVRDSQYVPLQRTIGAYLAQHQADRDILLDDRLAYPIIYWTGSARPFYTASDSVVLDDLVGEPRRFLRYLLVSHLGTPNEADTIDVLTKGLYQSGALWAALEQQWPANQANGNGWRLYRVLKSA